MCIHAAYSWPRDLLLCVLTVVHTHCRNLITLLHSCIFYCIILMHMRPAIYNNNNNNNLSSLIYHKWERFAALNLRIFRGYQEYHESFSVNIIQAS